MLRSGYMQQGYYPRDYNITNMDSTDARLSYLFCS